MGAGTGNQLDGARPREAPAMLLGLRTASGRDRGARDGPRRARMARGASWKGHGRGAHGVSRAACSHASSATPRAWSSRRAAGALAADEGPCLGQAGEGWRAGPKPSCMECCGTTCDVENLILDRNSKCRFYWPSRTIKTLHSGCERLSKAFFLC